MSTENEVLEFNDQLYSTYVGEPHDIPSHRRQRPAWNRPSIILDCLLILAIGFVGLFAVELSIPVAPNHALVEALDNPPALPDLNTLADRDLSPPIVDTPPRTLASNNHAQRALERKPTPPVAVSKVERVIAFALRQQGKPYRWNQTGPRGFDCSGLVVASFRSIGITLPHYTGDLRKRGIRISRSAMHRGDLIFPASNHVGIYLGGNKMVVASSGKGKVIIQTVYAFYTARRLV